MTKSVAAPPAVVFATVADIVEWPHIIRSIRSVEVLTPGPLREGTRLREDRILFGVEATYEMEVVTIDRPHRLRLQANQRDLRYEFDHLFDAVYGGGCRMLLVFRSAPITQAGQVLPPLISPYLDINLRDQLEQDLSDLAAAVRRRMMD